MAHVTETDFHVWTPLDLLERFGPIPLTRVRLDPEPGTATEEDLLRISDCDDRLYELVDATLVEKAVGWKESRVGAELLIQIGAHAKANRLGIVNGADGMTRFGEGLVRLPDVSFVSWDRLPGREVPDVSIADFPPDLVVEVISRGNTAEEMDRKLREYFKAGVRQAWYVYPAKREVRIYDAPDKYTVLGEQDVLDGGEILPGFTLSVAEVFAKPEAPPTQG